MSGRYSPGRRSTQTRQPSRHTRCLSLEPPGRLLGSLVIACSMVREGRGHEGPRRLGYGPSGCAVEALYRPGGLQNCRGRRLHRQDGPLGRQPKGSTGRLWSFPRSRPVCYNCLRSGSTASPPWRRGNRSSPSRHDTRGDVPHNVDHRWHWWCCWWWWRYRYYCCCRWWWW